MTYQPLCDPRYEIGSHCVPDARGRRTSWEHWGQATEGARAAFARLVGVEAHQDAVGATVSELIGLIAAALPDGARVLSPEIELTNRYSRFGLVLIGSQVAGLLWLPDQHVRLLVVRVSTDRLSNNGRSTSLLFPFLAHDDRGIEAIHEHGVALANRFRAGLGLPASDSAIISTQVPDAEARLARADIQASVRAGSLRAAFHVYNTEADVDAALDALA